MTDFSIILAGFGGLDFEHDELLCVDGSWAGTEVNRAGKALRRPGNEPLRAAVHTPAEAVDELHLLI